MISINSGNISTWCKGAAIVFVIASGWLLFGYVPEPDERYAAMLDTREMHFPTDQTPFKTMLSLAGFELVLLIGLIVTLWFGNIWYLAFFAVETFYFVTKMDLQGPFLYLGTFDAILSVSASISEAFGAALVLMKAGLLERSESTEQKA